MKFVALALLLTLGGCLEAIDLAEEQIAGPDVCTTPTGVAICKEEGL